MALCRIMTPATFSSISAIPHPPHPAPHLHCPPTPGSTGTQPHIVVVLDVRGHQTLFIPFQGLKKEKDEDGN